jgi:hypothetical protein
MCRHLDTSFNVCQGIALVGALNVCCAWSFQGKRKKQGDTGDDSDAPDDTKPALAKKANTKPATKATGKRPKEGMKQQS